MKLGSHVLKRPIRCVVCIMPTLMEWEYEAKNPTSIAARRGKQRIHFGDAVVNDYLGQGRGLSLSPRLSRSTHPRSSIPERPQRDSSLRINRPRTRRSRWRKPPTSGQHNSTTWSRVMC